MSRNKSDIRQAVHRVLIDDYAFVQQHQTSRPHGITMTACRARLQKLADTAEATLTDVSEFPADLKPDEYAFVTGIDINNGSENEVVRLDRGNCTLLVLMHGSKYYPADRYESGQYDCGNHDFSLQELATQLLK